MSFVWISQYDCHQRNEVSNGVQKKKPCNNQQVANAVEQFEATELEITDAVEQSEPGEEQPLQQCSPLQSGSCQAHRILQPEFAFCIQFLK